MVKLISAKKFIVFFAIFITTFFLLPIFIGGIKGTSVSELFTDKSNGFTASLIRTFSFALLSAFVNVAGGFCLALILSKISLFTKLGKYLSFFILPITLGNLTIVFIFKILLFNTSFFNFIVQGAFTTQNTFLLFIQFWQYGFLFAYLFWLNIQNTPKELTDYASATRLTSFERIRDIILPQSRNLFILLFFIGFIFSFYDDAKSQFIFRASQGTGTELINHWLYRTYQSSLLINPIYASQSVFKTGLIIFSITLCIIILVCSIILIGFRLFSKIKNVKTQSVLQSVNSKQGIVFSPYIALFCITLITLPLIIALLKSQYSFSKNLTSLGFPLILAFIASITSTIFAITFGIESRLAFRKWLISFNSKSLFYFLSIFLLQIVPPLLVVLCGFKWLNWIGYNSKLMIHLVWIVGHSILTLPLLGSFIVATHFKVMEIEIDYLSAYHISRSSLVKYSFLKRFKAEYIFSFLFAFVLIWNDVGLNMVLSDYIPSFAANLQMLFIGRAADYSKASSFILIALALAMACIFIWQYIINKSVKFYNT